MKKDNNCKICNKKCENKYCSPDCYYRSKTKGKKYKSYNKRDEDVKKKAWRTCLGIRCRGERMFKSIWPGNRICPHCESLQNRREEADEQ